MARRAPAKRHLALAGTRKTACGINQAKQRTFTPAEVTCEGCKRSVHMADAEVRAVNQR